MRSSFSTFVSHVKSIWLNFAGGFQIMIVQKKSCVIMLSLAVSLLFFSI